jgi:hypothetical protein
MAGFQMSTEDFLLFTHSISGESQSCPQRRAATAASWPLAGRYRGAHGRRDEYRQEPLNRRIVGRHDNHFRGTR